MRVLSLVAIAVMLYASPSVEAPANNIGVYFDPSGQVTCLPDSTSFPFPLMGYVIAKNLADSTGIAGWEAILASSGGVHMTGFTPVGAPLVPYSFPICHVAYPEALPADSVLVLGTINLFVTSPGGIFLKPYVSLEGADSPVFAHADQPSWLSLFSYAYGDSGSPCATIGSVDCPQANVSDSFTVEDDSSSTEDAIDRELLVQFVPESAYLPDTDALFLPSSITYSSSTLRHALSSTRVQSMRRLVSRSVAPLTGRTARAPSVVSLSGVANAVKVRLPSREVRDSLLRVLNESPGVVFAERNGRIDFLQDAPTDDPLLESGELWHLHNDGTGGGTPGMDVGGYGAWTRTWGSPDIRIGIVDSGIDGDHPDLHGKVIGDPGHIGYHGTFVSGLAAAIANNGLYMTGLCPGATLIAAQKDNTGATDIGDAVAAIYRALNHGADIINMSWRIIDEDGVSYFSSPIRAALVDAYRLNVICVASMGNQYESGNPRQWPAAYRPGVIAVGSVDRNGVRASSSSTGYWIALAAPGENVTSIMPGPSYGVASGTSFAAPLVCGAAGLLLSLRASLTNDDVDALLKISALPRGPAGFDNEYGAGLLKVDAAIDSLYANRLFQGARVEGSESESEFTGMTYSTRMIGFPGYDPDDYYFVDVWAYSDTVTFPEPYRNAPHVWGRGNGTNCYPEKPGFNINSCEPVPGTITTTGCWLRSFYYRVFTVNWGRLVGTLPPASMPRILAYSVLGVPASVTAVTTEEGEALALRVGPNPSNGGTVISLQGVGSTRSGKVAIYDLRGRRVRELEAAECVAGTCSWEWNGTDASGRSVGSGVYMVRVSSGERTALARISLVK